MDQKIRKILDDLYEMEPQLKQDEQRLIKIITLLAEHKPVPQLDPKFVKQLRHKLLADRGGYEAQERSSIFSIINTNLMNKLNIAIGSVALVAVLAVGAFALYNGNNFSKNNNLAFDQGLKITSAEANAFGKLDTVSEINNTGGRGGSSNNLAAADSAISPEQAAIDGPRTQSGGGKMIAPPSDFPVYKYVYKGEALNLTETQYQVLKRQKGENVDTSGFLNSLNFGLANVNSFPNLRLQSVSFMSSDPEGYSVYVDVDNANVSISGAWPQPLMSASTSMCVDCGEQYVPIKLSDIPADDTLIAIANQFIADHGISTQAYGEPFVQQEWRRYYETSPDQSNYYLPDVMSIIYPLQIDGQSVYDEGGNPTGINVGISVRNSKVVSVSELSVQNYQSSSYEGETDITRIMKIAEQGGIYGYYDPTMPGARTVELELGEPRIEFVKMWNYKNNQSEELLIPSLIFPVMTQPEGEQYFRSNVVVPLVKDILNRNEYPIRTMPATEDAVVPNAATTPADKPKSDQ